MVGYYTQLFGICRATVDIDPHIIDASHKVTSFMNFLSTKKLSLSKLRKVVFGMGNNKVPRPDGYYPFFFKKTWSLIGSLLFSSCE